MGDILERIEDFLGDQEVSSELKYIHTKNVISILEFIIAEVKEDKVLLETVRDEVNRNWSQNNTKLIKNFYRILEYYGIVGETQDRKTILETKGKTIVRKFVNLKSQNRILKLL